MPSTLERLFHVMFTTLLWDRCHRYPAFTIGDTEACSNLIILPHHQYFWLFSTLNSFLPSTPIFFLQWCRIFSCFWALEQAVVSSIPLPLFSSSDSVPPFCSSVAMDSPPLKNPPSKPHTSCSSIFSALSAASAWDLLLRAVSFSSPGPHAHWFPHHTKDSVKDKCPWPVQFNQHHTCLCRCWTRCWALSQLFSQADRSHPAHPYSIKMKLRFHTPNVEVWKHECQQKRGIGGDTHWEYSCPSGGTPVSWCNHFGNIFQSGRCIYPMSSKSTPRQTQRNPCSRVQKNTYRIVSFVWHTNVSSSQKLLFPQKLQLGF